MASGRLILLGLLGLVVAEAAVFLVAAQAFGSFVVLFTLFATSVFGFLVLGRMGKRLVGRLADMLSRRDPAFGEAGAGGVLTVIGGILLVLPGFVTDAVGLLLLVPAVQKKLIDRGPVRRSRPSGRVLDLDRSQWRDIRDTHIPDGNKSDDRRKPRR
ncbi:FxsA family protein [Pseudorhodoplanes sinuspersici]|nr:FxsA family protein [Pseudorhodoplanes sinuspersici]RKE69323.1 UPF0716 family protein affecting phage T7 exclusion [Pseudorhodoplanes sinuspersici]